MGDKFRICIPRSQFCLQEANLLLLDWNFIPEFGTYKYNSGFLHFKIIEAEVEKVNGNGHVPPSGEIEEKPVNGLENGIVSEDKNVSVIVNGEEKADAREESILLDPATAKPRKGKVHLPPVLPPPPTQSPTRTSPRRNSEKIYKEFINEESGSSDSEDEEPSLLKRLAAALGHAHANHAGNDDEDDSDSEATDDDVERNSSSTDDDEEEDDDDEEDEDEEDEDESEDDAALNDVQEPGFDSGATAVMAFSKWEGDRLHLWVANAGDSR